MCAYCKHIDDEIARYRLFRCRINDQPTLDGITSLIQELEAKKLALHRDKQGKPVTRPPSRGRHAESARKRCE
jgi:hypothetical protein